MMRFPLPLIVFVLMSLAAPDAALAQRVTKTAESFDAQAWVNSPWNRAEGTTDLVAPGAEAEAATGAMAVRVAFRGQGFEFYTAQPTERLVIPGRTRKVTLRVRAEHDGQAYPWFLKFRDGWGREEVDGRKLDWTLGWSLPDKWQTLSFEVPEDWVQPIEITGLVTHNHNSQGKAGQARLFVDELTIETDLTDVDPASGRLKDWRPGPAVKDAQPAPEPITPLVTATLRTSDQHNVFAGRPAELVVQARSWLGEELAGTLTWSVSDAEGVTLMERQQPVRVKDVLNLTVPLPLDRFGWYQVQAKLDWGGRAETITRSLPLALIPKPIELTDAQKLASPWGLNVHGGRSRMVQTFRDAGVVWFRDYAFNYDWMVKAKGDAKRYDGWPWYPQIVRDYQQAGAMVLACHAGAIKPPRSGEPEGMEPTREWTRELIDMVLAFPSITHHELDNEYDLPSHGTARLEEPIGWRNYHNYHQKFGEALKLLGGGDLVTVENGRAGIWPDRLRAAIDSGAFDQIDVVNTHHYTGTDAPEVNVFNHNTDATRGEVPTLYFDQLREIARLMRSDGKARQHYHTEFGWDTKAGPVVSHREQAAYLQRGFLMLLAAGVDKGFWFFDLDAAKTEHFFDGCGLVDHLQQPKLALCSMAGMTHLLPTPTFVGMINAGDGTWGYLLENQGELVAALWTLDDVAGPALRFDGAKVYDYLANPLTGTEHTLGLTPTYAVGVGRDSRWFKQSAYMLASPYLVAATSGDTVTVTLSVENQRETTIRGSARLVVPEGWRGPEQATAFAVEPGQTHTVPLTFQLAPGAANGESQVGVEVREGDQAIKRIPLRVQVTRRLSMLTTALPATPGQSQTTVKIYNQSASESVAGELEVALPSGWSTPSERVAVNAIPPRSHVEIELPITWAATWKPGESAELRFTARNGEQARAVLAPGQIPRAAKLTIDAQLDDWPDTHAVPGWVLASNSGKVDAKLYLAWTDEGLAIAGRVDDSKLKVDIPEKFWLGDAIELFLSTNHQPTPGAFSQGDHQLWLVPQPALKRVYVGQWARGKEIAQTRYNVEGITSASVATEGGYVFELLIPKSAIQGFDPRVGSMFRLNLNLTACGASDKREVYWPAPKSQGTTNDPSAWGAVRLGD